VAEGPGERHGPPIRLVLDDSDLRSDAVSTQDTTSDDPTSDEHPEGPSLGGDGEGPVRGVTDDDGVLTVTLDDGDKNVLTPGVFDALIDVLDDHADARAVVVTGREGIFTAGLDLDWMAEHGREEVEELLVRFGECMVRWWTDPRPTVCAASGHAVAAGTMLAMTCDHAVAAEDGYWGLTEPRIGFEIPEFGLALARANVRTDRFEDLLLPGRRVDAATAAEVGFCDEVVPAGEVMDRARDHLADLLEVPTRSYAGTKHRLRGLAAREVLDGLRDDAIALTEHLDD
jgi:enoyl-CoA hydratase